MIHVINDEFARMHVIVPMSRDEAQSCLDGIRHCLDNAAGEVRRAELLAFELYERKGWEQLGYPTWFACMEAELPGKSRSRYYQLLKSGTTLASLVNAAES